MNAALYAIAEMEDDPNAMPDVPRVFVNPITGDSLSMRRVPICTGDFLLTCGTSALCAVGDHLGIDFSDIATKEELVDAILNAPKGVAA